MARSPRKFSAYTAELAESIEQMYVASLRKGMEEGLRNAVENTVQDSSNAAAHWMVGIGDSAYSRKFGQLRDMRGGGDPIVGNRGDNRDSTAAASAAIESIVAREVKTAIDRHIKGHKPNLNIYLYNAVATDPVYDQRAGVSDAGQYGIRQVQKHFEREIKLGNVRRHRRKV